MYDYTPNDVLLYEALFRHYRNAVVNHVRTCVEVAHGPLAEDRFKACFGGTAWNDIHEKADAADARGALARLRVDEFDYLDVGQFSQVVDHLYEDLVPVQWLGVQAKASKNSLQQWIQEAKNARDPAAHPGELDADVADVIRTVDTTLRVLKRLGATGGVPELQAIQAELFERAARPAEVGSVAPLDDSLPPAETVVEDFVGRGAELKQLRAWLKHPHRNRWILVGDGGKGKSAIAYEFAREVIEAAPNGLCGAFWLSAKRRKYQSDKIVDIPSPDFATLDECLTRILIDYGHHAAIDLSIEERQEQVMALLDELPCLLVVDDLDSLDEENEDVVEFLTLEAPRTASKVLLTSRRKFAGMGSTLTQVLGLSPTDARAFVDSRWTSTNLDLAALSETDRTRVVEVCEASPLYMGDLLRLCAAAVRRNQSDIPSVISDWSTKDGDTVRRYALQREMDMLTPAARRVLETLAVGARPMTVEELARIGAVGEHAVAAACEELRQLYLLSASALDEDTPRFGVEGNLAVLVRAEIQGGPRELQIRNALDAIDGKDAPPSQEVQIRDLTRQARLLLNANRVADAEQLVLRAMQHTPENRHLFAMLGMCYVAWSPRRNADARTQFQRAADLGFMDRGMFLAWSRIEGEIGEWSRAVAAAERGLSVRPDDPMLLRAAGQARTSLARQHLRALSREKAETEYERADEQLEAAVEAARRMQLRAVDISAIFGCWVTSAKEQQRPKAVCYRLEKWRKWKGEDKRLGAEVAAHSKQCPDGRHKIQA